MRRLPRARRRLGSSATRSSTRPTFPAPARCPAARSTPAACGSGRRRGGDRAPRCRRSLGGEAMRTPPIEATSSASRFHCSNPAARRPSSSLIQSAKPIARGHHQAKVRDPFLQVGRLAAGGNVSRNLLKPRFDCLIAGFGRDLDFLAQREFLAAKGGRIQTTARSAAPSPATRPPAARRRAGSAAADTPMPATPHCAAWRGGSSIPYSCDCS